MLRFGGIVFDAMLYGVRVCALFSLLESAMSYVSFQSALERLVNDESYRRKVAIEGKILTGDFVLSEPEFELLKQLGVRTGWIDGGVVSLEDVSCCCCCCP